MIGTIRKHSSWLWAIIIIATVAAFVVGYGPAGRAIRSGLAGGSQDFGKLYDSPISPAEFSNAAKEAKLGYYLSSGQWPDRAGRQTDFDMERESYFRLFLIKKVNDYHIKASDEEASAEAHNRLLALNHGQSINGDEFEKNVLEASGLTVADFERTVRHDLEIRELITLIGSSGSLVTPAEAQMLYVRNNTEVSAQAIFFSASNYLSEATITSEALTKFYTNQAANYRLPDRVQVTYVEFPITNYWEAAALEIAKTTNMDQQFDLYTLQNGTNYFGGATNAVQARQIFHARYHEQQAGVLARRDANDFATLLFDTNSASYLTTLAAQKGYTVKTSEPFDSRNGPKEFAIPLQFVEAAFHLSPEQPFTAAIPGEKAVYVMALDKQLPSELPSLEAIHGQVVSDLTRFQATMMARQATVRCFATITNDLATGKSFATACLDARVQPMLLPPFSLRTESNAPAIEEHVKFDTLKQAAFTVLPGHADYAGTEEGGVVVYVDSRLPVDQAKMNTELPYFIMRMRQSREQEAFNMWFSHNVDTAMHDVLIELQKRQGKNAQ